MNRMAFKIDLDKFLLYAYQIRSDDDGMRFSLKFPNTQTTL